MRSSKTDATKKNLVALAGKKHALVDNCGAEIAPQIAEWLRARQLNR